MVTQKKKIATGQEKTWPVDIEALTGIENNHWVEEHPRLLERDLKEMATAFPHWFLTVGHDKKPCACVTDGEYIVPTNGALRCIQCGEKSNSRPTSIIWTGLLPVNITGAKKVEAIVREKIGSGKINLPVFDKDGTIMVFAPIIAVYSSNWPHQYPFFYYTLDFFHALGTTPGAGGHYNHIVGDLQMCLFASWHQMSIREVIQNRVAPHALAIVKIANGERPQRWFN